MYSRIEVTAAPGKVGMQVVDNDANQIHTVISKVNDDSPLAGKVHEGDQLVTVNGIDVHQMDAKAIACIFDRQTKNNKLMTIARKITDDSQLKGPTFVIPDANLHL